MELNEMNNQTRSEQIANKSKGFLNRLNCCKKKVVEETNIRDREVVMVKKILSLQ